MSMSSVLSALRGAGRKQLSASTIAARQATGSHVLRIDGYTQVTNMAANTEITRSGKFSVGGHDWRIMCYPNGYDQGHQGYISFFLEHASHALTGDATAKMELSILDESSKPTYSQATTEFRFTGDGRARLGLLGEDLFLDVGWHVLFDFIKHDALHKEKHLSRDDCLTVLCDVTVAAALHTQDHHVEDAGAPEPKSTPVVVVEPAPFDLSRGKLAEAIGNRQQVDVEIKVGGETFPAHRCVLEAQSPVLKADLSLASTATGIAQLRVDDMDAEVFKAMLQFMYTDTPPLLLEAPLSAERLLAAADRYGLEKLKLVCEEELCSQINMSTVAATLELAERHQCKVLKPACMSFLSSPGNLEAFAVADGFKQLKTTGCQSALLELVVNRIHR